MYSILVAKLVQHICSRRFDCGDELCLCNNAAEILTGKAVRRFFKALLRCAVSWWRESQAGKRGKWGGRSWNFSLVQFDSILI